MTNATKRMKSIDLFCRNPYCIFDLPSNSTRSETLKRYDRFVKLSKLGCLSDWNYQYIIDDSERECDLASIQSCLQLFREDKYRLFWVTDSNSLELFKKETSIAQIKSNDLLKHYDNFIVLYFKILSELEENGEYEELVHLFKSLDYLTSSIIAYEDFTHFEKRFESFELEERNPTVLGMMDLLKQHIYYPFLLFIDDCSDVSTISGIITVALKASAKTMQIIGEKSILKLLDLISKPIEENKGALNRMLNLSSFDSTVILRIAEDLKQIEEKISNIFLEKTMNHSTSILRLTEVYLDCLDTLCWVNAIGGEFKTTSVYIKKLKANLMNNKSDHYNTTVEFVGAATKGYNQLLKGTNMLSKSEMQYKGINMIEYVYVMAANSGDDAYQYILGTNYLETPSKRDILKGLPYLPERGVEWLMRSAVTNSNAQVRLSICYMEGLGVYRSRETAIQYLKKAARNGNETAINIVRNNWISY